MVRIFVCLIVLTPFTQGLAQMKNPVKWHFAYIQKGNNNEVELSFTASIEDGFHIYSQFLEEGGPLPTTLTFRSSVDYELIGKVNELSTPIEKFDPTFMIPVIWFDKTAVFTQLIKLKIPFTTVGGEIEFMACTDIECLLPETVQFSIPVKVEKPEKKSSSGKVDDQKER